MKNLIKVYALALLLSSFTSQTNSEVKELMIGFHPNPELQELKWHLGTQEAIDHVISLDKLWVNKDYESMRGHLVDTLKVTDWDWVTFTNFDDFKASQESDSTEISWTFDYAYSVDIDPLLGGEHVQAGFTISSPKEDETVEEYLIHESYYIINKKIITLSQYKLVAAQSEE